MSTLLNPFYLGDVITGEPWVARRAEDVATNARWSRYRFAGAAVAIAMMVIAPVFTRGSANVPGETVERAAPAAICAQWDDIAKTALITAIRDGQERDLRLDTIVQLRHARRACRMGSLETACLEFNAITTRFQSAGADAPIACDAPGSGADRRIAGVLEGK